MRISSHRPIFRQQPRCSGVAASLPAKRPERTVSPRVNPIGQILSFFPEIQPFFDYVSSHPGAGVIDIAERLPDAVYNLLDGREPQGPFFRMIREGSHDCFFDLVCVTLNRENPVVIFNGRDEGQGGIGIFSGAEVFQKIFANNCALLIEFYRDRFEIQVPKVAVPTPDPNLKWIGCINQMGDSFFPMDVAVVLQGNQQRFVAIEGVDATIAKTPIRLTKRFLDLPKPARADLIFNPADSGLHALSAAQIVVFPFDREIDFYRFLLSDSHYAAHDPNLRAILAQRIGDLALWISEEQRKFRHYLKEFGSNVAGLYPDSRRAILALFPDANAARLLPERLEGFLLQSLPEVPQPDFPPLVLDRLPPEGILRWPEDF